VKSTVAVHGGAGRWSLDEGRKRAVLKTLREAVEEGLTAAERGLR